MCQNTYLWLWAFHFVFVWYVICLGISLATSLLVVKEVKLIKQCLLWFVYLSSCYQLLANHIMVEILLLKADSLFQFTLLCLFWFLSASFLMCGGVSWAHTPTCESTKLKKTCKNLIYCINLYVYIYEKFTENNLIFFLFSI